MNEMRKASAGESQPTSKVEKSDIELKNKGDKSWLLVYTHRFSPDDESFSIHEQTRARKKPDKS
jgi:hypothetical protein